MVEAGWLFQGKGKKGKGKGGRCPARRAGFGERSVPTAPHRTAPPPTSGARRDSWLGWEGVS